LKNKDFVHYCLIYSNCNRCPVKKECDKEFDKTKKVKKMNNYRKIEKANEKIDELCKQFEDYPNQLIDKMKVLYELKKIKGLLQ